MVFILPILCATLPFLINLHIQYTVTSSNIYTTIETVGMNVTIAILD